MRIREKTLRVLFVSIAFPPKSDSEGLQVAKYFKYLVKDPSLKIDILTSSDSTLFMSIDDNLKKLTDGYHQIIKVHFFENKYINFLLRKIDRDILNYPDSKFLFYKKWKSVVKQIKFKPDVIYSRSFPLSSTLMAYYLQKHFKVPWFLHLSDPWTLSPIHKLGKAKQWNEKMERMCFENATCISFTSLKTIEVYSQKYPEFSSKILFFPNVFDTEEKKQQEYIFKDKIKVVYTGGLIADRSPEYLFKAIFKIQEEYPNILSDFEFIFAGALDRKNNALFAQYVPSVSHRGVLFFSETIELQQSADLLLIIDTPFKNNSDALFFPSKLLDYMLAQRRILALTDKDSVTWNLVNGKLGNCLVHDDIDGIAHSLVTIWHEWKNRNISYFINGTIDMTYSAEHNAKRLASKLKEIVDEK
ncbi:hypothetical protein [Methylobacter sp. BlB1]|uniref:hypothetical protein n=1 Tax=Methylobacter sp. BlB1 TaxID=2785914 RepID=UPI001894F9B8|nr:hypothetical protein [Methylobacter sp. BlB1]MBF6650300.1 hypothetical protein [Methylobacter sp. BlB1]